MSANAKRALTVIAGVALIVLGIISLFFPGQTVFWLGVLVGLSIITSGVTHLVDYFARSRTEYGGGWSLLMGILNVLFGLIFMSTLGFQKFLMGAAIGWFALLYGIVRIVLGIRLHMIFRRWTWILTLGILGVILGLLMIILPGFSAGMVTVFCALFLIFMGFGLLSSMP